MKEKNFFEQCYKLTSQIPKGKVTTYKEIARALGSRGYRAVGNAMNRNPNAPKVPCHRVVCSDGRMGGYAYGIGKKESILKKEGIEFKNGKVNNLKNYLHSFKSRKNSI